MQWSVLAYANSFTGDIMDLSEANWIWVPDDFESRGLLTNFKTSFVVDSDTVGAYLVITADKSVTSYVNGRRLGSSMDWAELSV